ncbi:hypothetical protein Tco_1026206 [Tanacetum coccineum]
MHVDVCNTEEILNDAEKSRFKMKRKLSDPIAIDKKVNFVPIDYVKLNKLSETFVPQVELSLEQQYFSEASTSAVTPDNANLEKLVDDNTSTVVQKKRFVPKTEEKQILTKPVTSQTLPNKKKDVIGNTNVIASGMYKLKIYNNQETHAQSNKSVSTSTRLRGVISVRRPSSKSSSWKNSILSHIKIYPENVEVHVGKNKKINVTSHVNVFKTKYHVAKVNAENVLNVNVSVTYVSYEKNVLTLCQEKYVSKYRLSVDSKVRRSLFSYHIVAKSKFLDTTHVVAKTRFDIVTPLIAKDKDSSASL